MKNKITMQILYIKNK